MRNYHQLWTNKEPVPNPLRHADFVPPGLWWWSGGRWFMMKENRKGTLEDKNDKALWWKICDSGSTWHPVPVALMWDDAVRIATEWIEAKGRGEPSPLG